MAGGSGGPGLGPGTALIHLRVSLWLAIACGAAVRIWFAGTSGLYLDEAQVLAINSRPDVSSVLEFLRSHESHPPGYYLLTRLWLGIAGPSNESGVALSLIVGTLLIPLTFALVSRGLGSNRDAGAAAWLVALSPTLVRYSGMVRPYVVLGVLMLAVTWCLFRFLEHARWRYALGYAVCAALMVYSHNWSWLVLASLCLASVWWIHARQLPRVFVVRLGAANGLVVGLFLPWLPALLHQVAVAGHLWPKGLAPSLAEASWVATGLPLAPAVLICAALMILVLARWRAGLRLQTERKLLLALCLGSVLLSTGLAIVLSPLSPLLIPQCYAMLTPLVLVSVAAVLQLDEPPSRLAGGVLLVSLVAFLGHIAVTSRWLRSDTREIGGFLSGRVRGDDFVLLYPEYPAPTLARYFVAPGEVFSYPRPGLTDAVPFDHRLARDADSSALPEVVARIGRAAAARRRTWYVTLENPADYPPLRVEVERELDRQYGPPACVFAGSERPRLYEDMMVKLFDRGPDSAARDSSGRSRSCIIVPVRRHVRQ